MRLLGGEVKAIRDGKMSLSEAFCQFENGELFLVQSHIGEYVQAHGRNHPPLRKRKLLLHRKELERLQDAVKLEGVTIVPLAVYLKDRRLKLAIGVAKGKKLHDKRQSIKARDQAREMQRAKSEYEQQPVVKPRAAHGRARPRLLRRAGRLEPCQRRSKSSTGCSTQPVSGRSRPTSASAWWRSSSGYRAGLAPWRGPWRTRRARPPSMPSCVCHATSRA